MEHVRQNFCHFGLLFGLLLPNNPGNQNFEKMKQLSGDIIVLHMCRYHKWQSYDVLFPRYEVRQTEFFCHFGPFFPLLPDQQSNNQNFEEMRKTPEDKNILHNGYDICCTMVRWTDRRTGRKSNIQRWTTHLKINFITCIFLEILLFKDRAI